MSEKLFGIAVPSAAISVVIRPVLGPGGSLPCYSGPIGSGITETDIIVAVSKNEAWWEYVDSRKCQPLPSGLYGWKLRVVFINSGGTDGEVECTEKVIEEFYRSVKSGKGAGADAEEAISRIIAAGLAVIDKASIAAATIIDKASANAAAMMQSGSVPAVEAIRAQTEQRKDDISFRDEAMKVIGGLNNELRGTGKAAAEQEGSPWELLAFMREAREFLGKKKPPN